MLCSACHRHGISMFKLTLPALPGLRPRARLLLARIRRACLPLPRAPGEPEPRIGRRRTWRSAKQGPGPGRAERRAIQVIQSAVTVPGRPSQKDFKLGDPRCCCTVLDRGHQTGPPSGRRAIQAIQSADTVTVPRGIGLTEALARAGRPSQEDFKLGCPRCCCTVTVPGSGHRQGHRRGRRAIQVIQSAVTVPGGIGLSHRSTGAYGPSQS